MLEVTDIVVMVIVTALDGVLAACGEIHIIIGPSCLMAMVMVLCIHLLSFLMDRMAMAVTIMETAEVFSLTFKKV